jgi:hypothetical protein
MYDVVGSLGNLIPPHSHLDLFLPVFVYIHIRWTTMSGIMSVSFHRTTYTPRIDYLGLCAKAEVISGEETFISVTIIPVKIEGFCLAWYPMCKSPTSPESDYKSLFFAVFPPTTHRVWFISTLPYILCLDPIFGWWVWCTFGVIQVDGCRTITSLFIMKTLNKVNNCSRDTRTYNVRLCSRLSHYIAVHNDARRA